LENRGQALAVQVPATRQALTELQARPQ
jgi:hypothetical protein